MSYCEDQTSEQREISTLRKWVAELEAELATTRAELAARQEVDAWVADGREWRSVYRSRNDSLLHAVKILADDAMASATAHADDYPSLAAALRGAK